MGKYSFCSFSTRGVGRFRPDVDAKPHIGSAGNLERVEEERIEVTVSETLLHDVVVAIKKVHPYEEIALDIYKLEQI